MPAQRCVRTRRHVIFQYAIVRNMTVRHQQTVVAYFCRGVEMGAAMYLTKLMNVVVIADMHQSLIDVVAMLCRGADTHMAHKMVPVSDFCVGDITVRTDSIVVAEDHAILNNRAWMNRINGVASIGFFALAVDLIRPLRELNRP